MGIKDTFFQDVVNCIINIYLINHIKFYNCILNYLEEILLCIFNYLNKYFYTQVFYVLCNKQIDIF